MLEPNALDVTGMGGTVATVRRAVASRTGVVRREGVPDRTVTTHRRTGSQRLKPGVSL